MKVLIVGGGAREHAIAWKLNQSPLITGLYCASGNGGTATVAENVALPIHEIEQVADWALAAKIDLAVIGPEGPLVAGIADAFAARDLPVFGPSRNAARLEGSKAWAKDLMLRHGIPTASGAVFSSAEKARNYVRSQHSPVVVKADGLAAGKGVVVATSTDEALAAIHEIMENRAFGAAGEQVLIEERLDGLEVSVLAITDGERILTLPPACDYKRVYDADKGPNTGGMGAYSAPAFFTSRLSQEINDRILVPTIRAMAAEGNNYRGVLYAGLMLTERGPRVLEFNCRFGDPETQVLLPRLKGDVLPIFDAAARGTLAGHALDVDDGFCCGVVLASGGYPGQFDTGFSITGLDAPRDALVFHAGTELAPGGGTVTAGGRVLTVVGKAPTVQKARAIAYAAAEKIKFEGRHYRKDIAQREMK